MATDDDGSRLSAVEREVTQVRSDLAVAAAGIGTFDWDLVTGRLVWDERLTELFGYTAGEFDETIESFNQRLHPDDAERVRQAITGAIDRCTDYEAEYRVVRPDGEVRWVEARGRALPGTDGTAVRLIGAGYDTTAQHDGEARVGRVLETMGTAFFSLDRSWRFTYVNAEAERVLGHPREDLLGEELWACFPFALGSEFELQYRGSVASGRPASFEAHYPEPLDRWYEVRAWPGPDGLSVYFHDVTDRRAAEDLVRAGVARSTLLAEVASELASTLDAEDAVGRLARLVVPTLAQWCIVSLIDHGATGSVWQRLRDVGWWHADPAKRPVVERYAHLRLAGLGPGSLVARALLAGTPAAQLGGATETISALLGPGPADDALRRLAPVDVLVLPLRARGRSLGVLSLYDASGERGYGSPRPSDDDRRTAIDVAARAGLALDNARLYDQQRRVAEGLQRVLLTDPPHLPGLQIAVRYQPAAEAARVGGDWYDAFRARDGVLSLVIGDVVGHDIEAAAAMGQVRAVLRGIATTTGEGPAQVLTRLDTVLDRLQVGVTATALVAELELAPGADAPSTDDLAPPTSGATRLRWSSAGHPTPFVIRADGTVEDLGVLSAARSDLLLGIDHTYQRAEHEVWLEPGATLLLFTDGLVERRGERYLDGLRRLAETLTDLAGTDLERLCDELLRRVLPRRPGDDVALAAVRLATAPGQGLTSSRRPRPGAG